MFFLLILLCISAVCKMNEPSATEPAMSEANILLVIHS